MLGIWGAGLVLAPASNAGEDSANPGTPHCVKLPKSTPESRPSEVAIPGPSDELCISYSKITRRSSRRPHRGPCYGYSGPP